MLPTPPYGESRSRAIERRPVTIGRLDGGESSSVATRTAAPQILRIARAYRAAEFHSQRQEYKRPEPVRPRGRTMWRFRLRLRSRCDPGAGSAAAGGVVAATQSSDERVLQPTREPADNGIESRVNRLLARMTLEEKLEQIQLLPDFLVTDEEVRKGLGSVLSVTDPARIREVQRIAVEESRLGIPILFAFDTIHGFRTVFPIPLGAGASFDPQMASDDHKYGARNRRVRAQAEHARWSSSHEPVGRNRRGRRADPTTR